MFSVYLVWVFNLFTYMYGLIGLDMFLFGFISLCFLVANGFVLCFLIVLLPSIVLLLFLLYVLKYGRTNLFF